jgi:hypothetical protein
MICPYIAIIYFNWRISYHALLFCFSIKMWLNSVNRRTKLRQSSVERNAKTILGFERFSYTDPNSSYRLKGKCEVKFQSNMFWRCLSLRFVVNKFFMLSYWDSMRYKRNLYYFILCGANIIFYMLTACILVDVVALVFISK